VNFSFPLLVRKERAKLKATNLKRQENNLKLDLKRREINNKIEQSFNKIIRLADMIQRQEAMIINYQRMLDGERIRFNNGESSIFLINSRENKKLEAEMKLIELKVEYGRSIALMKWSSGILANEVESLSQ
jgi:outer membrane protein TolC